MNTTWTPPWTIGPSDLPCWRTGELIALAVRLGVEIRGANHTTLAARIRKHFARKN